ncbi:MAG: TonB-dependent receptor, partial [Terriglobales bacterium]
YNQPDMAAYNFNFGLQYEFPSETVVSVAWVGSRGLHLIMSNNAPDLNGLRLNTIEKYQGNLLNMVNYPDAAAITDPTAPWYGATQVPQWVMLQPYPQFSAGNYDQPGGGIFAWGAGWGDSIYHSLQAKVEKRLTSHFTMLASFTWGKTISDNDSAPLAFNGNNESLPQNWYDLQLERGLSDQDIPLYFSWEVSYDLPIGTGRELNLSGLSNFLAGGWTVSAIATLSDGQPIATPLSTTTTWLNQRVDIVGSCATGAPQTSAEWFNYSCMASPTNQFMPGTAGPVLPGVRTDGAHNLDLSIQKHFPFSESKDLSLQLAAYNFTNSVQYGYPNVFWNEGPGVAPNPNDMPNFAQITNQVNTPRQVSAELRFTF